MSKKAPWGVVIMEKRLSNTGLRNAFPKLGAGAKPHLPQGLSWSLLPSLRTPEVIRLASGLGSSQLWSTVGHSPAAEMPTRPFMYPRLPPIPIFLQIFLSVSLICFWMRLHTSRHVKNPHLASSVLLVCGGTFSTLPTYLPLAILGQNCPPGK